jgi:DNA-binding NarL/FixJ family response regulator
MSQQQVGFTFQGDVFLGSSLAFSVAGTLMKILLDAGVDTYAVAAVLQLGKVVPISQHQEKNVSASMLKRHTSRAGHLARALQIGWSCNDIAYELSRTREGSAALMLADAFAAGRSYYIAA